MQDIVIPVPPNSPWYVEKHVATPFTLDDTQFEHDDAWCYPLHEFSLIDIDSGFPVQDPSSYMYA